MEDEISIDLLIDEIEKRNAIWNLNLQHYSARIIKRRSCNYNLYEIVLYNSCKFVVSSEAHISLRGVAAVYPYIPM
ncbi:unnamed protein product [Euphydryas editha]|uniref:Uncharacterized protein n=1 Tax=Euphydryas editha TaxID=104508 RepID=A0AAU9V8Z2_EUPED|nr:unnamed protein product [Euphydryas editha]